MGGRSPEAPQDKPQTNVGLKVCTNQTHQQPSEFAWQPLAAFAWLQAVDWQQANWARLFTQKAHWRC